MEVDLAGQKYWEKTWQDRPVLGSINLKNYTQARFDTIFRRYLPRGADIRLLETGCAQSSWLPYFRLRFDYEIFGLDYSETGCEKASQNLLRYGVEGTILCRDFMEEHSDLQRKFDIVFSYGVVEHFVKPEVVLKRFWDFLKPGGMVVTIIPNVLGIMGWLQRKVNRSVYDLHVPMCLEDLRRVHLESGFEGIWSGYVGSLGTEVVNYPADVGLGWKMLRKLLKWVSKGSWFIFRLTRWHPESLLLSPYVFFIGSKPPCKKQKGSLRKLTILHTESSLGWGGQEVRIYQEAQALSKLGHRVLIAAQPESLLLKEARQGGIEVIPLTMTRASFPVALFRLLRLIRQHRIDIVNSHSSLDSWIASLAGRLSRRRPWILRTRHIHVPVKWGGLIYGRLPHRVITTSEEIRQELIKETGVKVDHIFTIPTGVDTNQFYPGVSGTFRKELGITREMFLIGMVSVLRSWKGHRYFMEAADLVRRKVSGAFFVIVGEGPMRPLIELWYEELHLEGEMILTGFRRDIPEILSGLDLLVLPSFASEGIPQAILQAMAMAKPVVASDIGGIREVVIPGETGYLVPPRDPAALADRIIDLMNDPSTRERMGQQARKLVTERWTLERTVERVLEVYQGLYRQGL